MLMLHNALSLVNRRARLPEDLIIFDQLGDHRHTIALHIIVLALLVVVLSVANRVVRCGCNVRVGIFFTFMLHALMLV